MYKILQYIKECIYLYRAPWYIIYVVRIMHCMSLLWPHSNLGLKYILIYQNVCRFQIVFWLTTGTEMFKFILRYLVNFLLLYSVAEPEPVGAGTFWSEPEPVWRCEGKNTFFTTYLAYFYMKRSRSRWKKSIWSRSKKDRLRNTAW